MRKSILIALVALAAFSCSKQITEVPHVSEKIVGTPQADFSTSLYIKLSSGATLTDAGIDQNCAQLLFPGKSTHSLDRWYRIALKDGISPAEYADILAQSSFIETIQFPQSLKKAYVGEPVPYSAPATKSFSGSDPLLEQQWALGNSLTGADINIREAWKLCAGDPGVIVAVVDEGVCYTHPDLKDNISPLMHNFISGEDNVTWNKKGDSGHATHVAGVIAAVNGNAEGICGIAGGTPTDPGVQIMSLQVFDGEAETENSALAQAFIYAADHGASILQCSLTLNSYTIQTDADYAVTHTLERDALLYFLDNAKSPVLDGGIAIFAAGNDSESKTDYPGAYPEMISVSAFASDWHPCWFTNYGKGCNIAAPGGASREDAADSEKILSTVPDGYAYMEGTSMACPHVSGVAALGLSYAMKLGKKFTAEQFKAMLLTSTGNLDSHLPKFYKGKMGTGSIDAWRMLMQVEGTPAVQCVLGESNRIDLDAWFGEQAGSLNYLDATLSEEDTEALGIVIMPYISKGQLVVYPGKAGCGKIQIRAVAGGKDTICRTISIISRDGVSENGGWL